MRPLLSVMPQGKQDHSKRVAKRLHNAGASRLTTITALTHDYLERGGNIHDLVDHLKKHNYPTQVAKIVQVLSSDEKNQADPDDSPSNPPLEHLKAATNALDSETCSIAALIKISDRLDNVIKRLRKDGRLAKQYRQKSIDIATYCSDIYNDDPEPFSILYSRLMKLLR
jgi:(p)ppGpp synthase/HD superfamily hydrolase